MDGIKGFLTDLRNALAFSYSWLVVCTMLLSALGGKDSLTISFLFKLLVLCAWAAFCFVLCFRTKRIQQKGFIFSLTCFYILFIPAEIALFYLMGIFTGPGNRTVWLIFFALITVMYIISLLIDLIVMRRKALSYTEKLKAFIS